MTPPTRRGIKNLKEGNCIPLTPAPHSSPPTGRGFLREFYKPGTRVTMTRYDKDISWLFKGEAHEEVVSCMIMLSQSLQLAFSLPGQRIRGMGPAILFSLKSGGTEDQGDVRCNPLFPLPWQGRGQG